MKLSSNSKINVSTPVVVICPGVHGHAAARSLGRLGVKVYGIHAKKNSPAAKSKYWKENYFWDLSEHSTDESLEWFQILARKFEEKPILISTDDDSNLFVDDNVESLKDLFLFQIQPVGLARVLSNKKLLYSLCKEKSILTPETLFPKSIEDIEDFNKRASFPVMLKGIDTVALQKKVGVRMVIVNDGVTLLKLYNQMESRDNPNLMIQEYIPGESQDVWMFNGYFNTNSDCLFGIIGKKIRQYPAYTGMTSLGICESNELLFDKIKEFMKSINYKGILDIGYKLNPSNGKFYLLDPNPRLGRTFRLFVDSTGMDVVRALYLDLTSQKVQKGSLVEGRKWVDESLDIVSSFQYWRDGNLKIKEWLTSYKNVNEAQWFAKDDLKPFFSIWPYSLGILGSRIKN